MVVGRIPGRGEPVLRDASIEQHISRFAVNVLDRILDAPADDVQRVDLIAHVGQAARTAIRNHKR